MKISDILKTKKYTFSFEVFPPKTTDKMEAVIETAERIAGLEPDFMSVTYGAGGGRSLFTTAVANDIQSSTSVPVLAHLTCLSSTKEQVNGMLESYRSHGIENIMALRGDIPQDGELPDDFRHASELIRLIKDIAPDMTIGGACYPEGHPESESIEKDLVYIKEKVSAGCDFLTTQMFFDNDVMYRYEEKLRNSGIGVPVLAGIMPITRANQLGRSVTLSGTTVPRSLAVLIEKYGHDNDSMAKAGIEFACEQAEGLISHGINNIHIYSMNRPMTSGTLIGFLRELTS